MTMTDKAVKIVATARSEVPLMSTSSCRRRNMPTAHRKSSVSVAQGLVTSVMQSMMLETACHLLAKAMVVLEAAPVLVASVLESTMATNPGDCPADRHRTPLPMLPNVEQSF